MSTPAGDLDNRAEKRDRIRLHLNARPGIILDRKHSEEKKDNRGRATAAQYAAWSVLVSLAFSIPANCFLTRRTQNELRRQDRRFEIRRDVQRELIPTVERANAKVYLIRDATPDVARALADSIASMMEPLDQRRTQIASELSAGYDSTTASAAMILLNDYGILVGTVRSMADYPRFLNELHQVGDRLIGRGQALIRQLITYQ